jgi:hypothetical protein
MNATISEDDKMRIKQYLLGQLAEADEEIVELRLMSDPAFSEEFDIVVDEIATLYVSRQFTGEEKTQVEQYFLRSPQRRLKVQFICELLRQLGEDGDNQSGVMPVGVRDQRPTLWQRLGAFWAQPSLLRPALSFAIVLIVGGLVFWMASLNSTPTYQSFELAMTTSERSEGTETRRIHLERGFDGLRIKLKLPTPTAPQYRASLQGATALGEHFALPQLAVETPDATSITVIVPTDQITRGTYAIELTEINNGRETPLRGAYVFEVD